jgi:transglutaminase-like putative cysteine protease
VVTLEVMANLARQGAQNPKIRDYAESIPGPYAIDSVIRSLYRYRDENEEIVRTPAFMLNDLETLGYFEGDCDDIATFTATITKAMNLPTRLTGIQSEAGHGEYDHVFSEFLVGSSWFPIDLTVDPGTSYSVLGYMSEAV